MNKLNQETPLAMLSIKQFLELINANHLSEKEFEVDKLLTVEALADYLTISKHTVRKYIKDLPHMKLGRRIVFRKTDIDEWLEGKECETAFKFKQRLNKKLTQKGDGYGR